MTAVMEEAFLAIHEYSASSNREHDQAVKDCKRIFNRFAAEHNIVSARVVSSQLVCKGGTSKDKYVLVVTYAYEPARQSSETAVDGQAAATATAPSTTPTISATPPL